jgi:hypothetical protein
LKKVLQILYQDVDACLPDVSYGLVCFIVSHIYHQFATWVYLHIGIAVPTYFQIRTIVLWIRASAVMMLIQRYLPVTSSVDGHFLSTTTTEIAIYS